MTKSLRVIGGTAGGRRLVAPKSGTRPTSDRVKEALFNVLDPRVVGASVLDLYAGSGALGIEALSRGADFALFVDHDHAATGAIRANLDALGFAAAAQVARSSVRSFCSREDVTVAFDLVFVDPPYDIAITEVDAVIGSLATPGWLAPDARVVVERPKGGPRPTLPGEWRTEFDRVYGDTLLLIVAP